MIKYFQFRKLYWDQHQSSIKVGHCLRYQNPILVDTGLSSSCSTSGTDPCLCALENNSDSPTLRSLLPLWETSMCGVPGSWFQPVQTQLLWPFEEQNNGWEKSLCFCLCLPAFQMNTEIIIWKKKENTTQHMRVLQNVCGKARINDKFYYYKDILKSMNSKVLRVFMEKSILY